MPHAAPQPRQPGSPKTAGSHDGAHQPAASPPAIISRQSLTNAIKFGLVGCGTRGTGAAAQALKADPCAELSAVADIDLCQVAKCLHSLKKLRKVADRVKTDNCEFVGLDAYDKLIRSDVDLVLLATPPAFRPLHLAACVDARKHIFCEKPAATDAHGIRWASESVEKAKQRDLCLVGGLCMRYHPVMQDMFGAISQGAIGRITAYHATYFSCPVRPMLPASARPHGMADTEWQLRNWYNFVWLSGDGLVEQAIHSVDRISWAMNDQPPLHCIGTGGRAVPAPDGNIYDHFSVTYTYPDNVQAVLHTRQMDGCYNGILDYIMGSEGACSYGLGPYPAFHRAQSPGLGDRAKAAANVVADNTKPLGAWMRMRAEEDMYQAQQNALLSAIRNHTRIDDGRQIVLSTRLALMGRSAAYTGQRISWDQFLKSDERLVPQNIDLRSDLKVSPRAHPGQAGLR